MIYVYIYMYCISFCVQARPLFSPACFTYSKRSKNISYSQHNLRNQRHRCKHSQMLPRRYSYVQLRQQIAYVGSTSQACIFLPRDVPVIANWDFFFMNDVSFNRTEPNHPNPHQYIHVAGLVLAKESFQTDGCTALWALTLACLTPVKPIERFSADELDAWQKGTPQVSQFVQRADSGSGQVVSQWPLLGSQLTQTVDTRAVRSFRSYCIFVCNHHYF